MRQTTEKESLAGLVGRRLREIRKAQGLRQQDLEDRGISYKYYQRIESGKVNLTLRSLDKLASALKTPVLDFFASSKPKVGLSGKRRRKKKISI